MNTCLMSTGSTCYPNNILIAQVWTTLLTTSFELDTWGAWTQPIDAADFEYVYYTCGGGSQSMPWFVSR